MYTFRLRENVKFHDGVTWNCQAAKLNFDHILVKPLVTVDYHGWYGLPGVVTDWKLQW
jgi:ABC-type transport system substrate-binding protein